MNALTKEGIAARGHCGSRSRKKHIPGVAASGERERNQWRKAASTGAEIIARHAGAYSGGIGTAVRRRENPGRMRECK